MTDNPVLDGRTREDLLDHLKDIAPYYVEDWDPTRDDVGTAIAEIFSDITEDIIERLDRVPEKHQAAFLNMLDFEPYPPQPSKVPIKFAVDDRAEENVAIEPGTIAVADGTNDRPEQRFETVSDETFEATPAVIKDVYATDPGTDWIVDHSSLPEGDERTELFMGENCQSHEYYIGHPDVLNLEAGSTLEVEIDTNAPTSALRDYIEWEYFGEDEHGDEGWHSLTVLDRVEHEVAHMSQYQQVESFIKKHRTYLKDHGYTLITDQDGYDTLVRSIADDIRKGRFQSGDDDEEAVFELPANLFDTQDVSETVVRRMQHGLEGLQKRLEATTFSTQLSTDFDQVSLSFEIPGQVTEMSADGIESRWIRGRIPDNELASPLFDILIDSTRLAVGSDTESSSSGLSPDIMIANDVLLEMRDEQTIFPLGDNPAKGTSFYLACEEALTKPGAQVTVTCKQPEPADGDDAADEIDPNLAWEYWDGKGWRRLSVNDGTANMQSAGTVSFEVPPDIASTSVLGHQQRWVRARLIGGSYGEFRMEQTDPNNWERIDDTSPPEYSEISVQYRQSEKTPDHQITYNSLSYTDVSGQQETFKPFKPLEREKQTLYLGFDAPLSDGPIRLYLPMEGAAYPHDFNPWIDMEYCVDPSKDKWSLLSFRDTTADLTERGMLEFSLPEETSEFKLFGEKRHWIRISLTGHEFDRSERGLFGPIENTELPSNSPRELSSVTLAEREQSDRTRAPPVLKGLHLNTVWAKNIVTIEDEILGSSSETADQEFSFSETPVLTADIWVDEFGSISKREQRRLENDDSTTVDKETDSEGSVTAFWVQWTGVDNFFNTDASSRHYILTQSDGTVRFGNGNQGAIPPAGENNIKAEYQTGGGSDGNISAGDITGLVDDLPFIDSVTNPDGGEHGEDKETVSEFVSRAPKQLRDRDCPVTRDGFERIASSAAREIAQVQCRAGKAETGAVGNVTLIVVPDTANRKPVPSEGLLKTVREQMRTKVPEAVVAEEGRLTVRGPDYVQVTVDAAVVPAGSRNTTGMEEEAKTALTEFTHPLTGGLDGDGWEIGTVPAPAEFSSSLERLDSIERVTELTVTYDDGENKVTSASGGGAPTVPLDVLIYSGRHTVTVEFNRNQ